MMNDLPRELCSEATQQPFECCNVCDSSLENKVYSIEKNFQKNLSGIGHFVLFEMAVCEDCKREMIQHISGESLRNMKKFMNSFQQQIEDLPNDLSLTHCSFSGEPINEMDEYRMAAVIRNHEILVSPMLMGIGFMMEYEELLSQETKDFLEDFYDENTQIPPDFKKLFDNSPSKVVF